MSAKGNNSLIAEYFKCAVNTQLIYQSRRNPKLARFWLTRELIASLIGIKWLKYFVGDRWKSKRRDSNRVGSCSNSRKRWNNPREFKERLNQRKLRSS